MLIRHTFRDDPHTVGVQVFQFLRFYLVLSVVLLGIGGVWYDGTTDSPIVIAPLPPIPMMRDAASASSVAALNKRVAAEKLINSDSCSSADPATTMVDSW